MPFQAAMGAFVLDPFRAQHDLHQPQEKRHAEDHDDDGDKAAGAPWQPKAAETGGGQGRDGKKGGGGDGGGGRGGEGAGLKTPAGTNKTKNKEIGAGPAGWAGGEKTGKTPAAAGGKWGGGTTPKGGRLGGEPPALREEGAAEGRRRGQATQPERLKQKLLLCRQRKPPQNRQK